MKIGLDFDDILLDCNTSAAIFHNSRYGTSYGRKDVKSHDWGKIWNTDKEETIKRILEWYDSPEHSESLPIPGAIDAIKRLSKEHELYVITSRPKSAEEVTRKWIDSYFPNSFLDICFTNHFVENRISKAEACKKLGVEFLVEDQLIHARETAREGIKVLLFDTPWNQEDLEENIIRVFDWDDIFKYVEEMQLAKSALA